MKSFVSPPSPIVPSLKQSDDDFANVNRNTHGKRRLQTMFVRVLERINKNKMVNNLKHNVPKEGAIKANLSQCDIRATVAA